MPSPQTISSLVVSLGRTAAQEVIALSTPTQVFGPTASVSAAGSIRSTATVLALGRSTVSGTTGQGVRVPVMTPGQLLIVANVSSPDATLKLYPPEGGNFAGFAANAPFNFISGNSYWVFCDTATQFSVTGGEMRNPPTDDFDAAGTQIHHLAGITDATDVIAIDPYNRQLDGAAGTASLSWDTGKTGFNGTAAISKPTVTGSRGANAALASLLTALANYGLITDSTS